MPGKGEGRGRDGTKKEMNGGRGGGRKVRTPPPSIPAYAPVLKSKSNEGR